MIEKLDYDLKQTRALFGLLQGTVPDGCEIPEAEIPTLSADQAWTVVWWLGNAYWQVPDSVERCDVCGTLYHAHREGECLDFGDAPYFFCDSCINSPEYHAKEATKPA